MNMKKVVIYALRAILSMFLFGILFFSVVDFNLEKSLKFLYEDIYDYASPIAQHSALKSLNEICQNEIEQGSYSIAEYQKLCENKEELDRLVKRCQELKGEMKESCGKILSGELIKDCSGLKALNPVNMSELSSICQKYTNRDISEPEFFSGFLFSQVLCRLKMRSCLFSSKLLRREFQLRLMLIFHLGRQ